MPPNVTYELIGFFYSRTDNNFFAMIFSSFILAIKDGPVDTSSGAIPRTPLYYGINDIPSVFVISKNVKPDSTQKSFPQFVRRHILSLVVRPMTLPAPKGKESMLTELFY